MIYRYDVISVGIGVLLSMGTPLLAAEIGWSDSGKGGAVAAGGADAVAAGIQVLEQGGNAADAAAATLLALAVTDYGSFAIGGEVPILVYEAKTQTVKTLSGIGGAPLDPEAIRWLYEHGIPSKGSMKAAPTPAAVDTIVTLLRLYGTVSFEQAVGKTLELLDRGKEEWHPRLAVTLRKLIEAERKCDGSRDQKLMAARDRFYRGDVADELEAWYIATGAWLRKRDLEAHRTLVEDPVSTDYRGYTVVKCGPWTQGPVLCQNLELLETFSISDIRHLSSDFMHLVIEAMKLGYADRDEYYADPRFAKVPMEQLLSQSYTQLRRSLIDLRVASMDRRPGDPILHRALATTETPAPLGDAIPKQDTTTCVVADRFGNWIAATPSCNLLTNKPGPSGVNTGNRVRSLNTAPGHPNRVEAGKRPRITLTPTLVLREGKPVVAISVAGGDLQDQTTLNLLISHIDYGLLPADAVTQPRFSTSHHQDSFDPNPDRTAAFVLRGGVAVNDTIPASVQKEMAERGHVIKVEKGPIAHPVMIYLDRTTGTMYAAGDPAAKRHAKAIP
jgi:gamma-glutamyltranspeptidase/glutathione hydrolase